MKILKKEKKFCISCMKEHDVFTIIDITKTLFKDTNVEFEGIYEYCENTEEMWATDGMINENGKKLIEKYKEVQLLLKQH